MKHRIYAKNLPIQALAKRAQARARARVCVCVCVCLSLSLYLSLFASVCLQNDDIPEATLLHSGG
jgi:hypothetical protein